MSRQSPKIIDQFDTDEVSIQVLESEGVWAVLKNGKAFGLRRAYTNNPSRFRYSKSLFPSKGHALSLARKLNHLFACDEFEAVLITPGDQ